MQEFIVQCAQLLVLALNLNQITSQSPSHRHVGYILNPEQQVHEVLRLQPAPRHGHVALAAGRPRAGQAVEDAHGAREAHHGEQLEEDLHGVPAITY